MTYRIKFLIDPDRVRKIPKSFSWIDRRFLAYLDLLRPECALLYYFLVTVSDPQGLSFYSDKKIARLLKIPLELLGRVRAQLMAKDLIAYQAPFYQVLALEEPIEQKAPGTAAERGPGEGRIADILKIHSGEIQYGRFVIRREEGSAFEGSRETHP